MKKYYYFFTPWIALFLLFTFFPLLPAEENLPAIVKKIEPSVVVITTYDKEGKILGQGSGFFISKNGDVITNRHVLEGANQAYVKTAGGKMYSVKTILAEDKDADLIRVSVERIFRLEEILGTIPEQKKTSTTTFNPDEYLAKTKIPEQKKTFTTGDELLKETPPKTKLIEETLRNEVYPVSISTSAPQVGERVIVVGAPLGLEKTASDGIVSAVRDIPSFGKIIQISAPISQGSSGSPVVNMKGEVIGVATFLMLEGQNLNFAIPTERVVKLTPGKGQTLAQWQAGRTEEWLTSAEGLYSCGLFFLWAEDYEKALPYFEEVTKKNPRSAQAYFAVGYCCGRLGRYTEAIESYKQAIRIQPDLAPVHSRLGWTYGRLGRYTEAIEAYKQAIRIQPDDANAHYYLGLTYLSIRDLGRYTEAIEAYKQAIRIKPDYAEAHSGLGLAYLLIGDKGSALDQYKILKDLDKDLANELFNLIYK